jgi:hypothetical protein
MPIVVLQVFHTYLKTTENWSYNIISNFINTNIVVGSKHFEKCNFYNSKFKYIEFPLRQIEAEKPSYLVKKYNKFVRSMLRHFLPGYIRRFAGFISFVDGNIYRCAGTENYSFIYGFDGGCHSMIPSRIVRYQTFLK